jgi:glycosyltransferase involved in cell wall biosynthesis
MKILVANKYWRPQGGVEQHVFAVRDMLEARGHQVVPFAVLEPSTLPTPFASYFPRNADMRSRKPLDALRGLDRAVRSADTRQAVRRLVEDAKVDAAYVVHVYHQLGPSLLNVLADMKVPTVLSLHDYKVGCPNYRYFSEQTGQACFRCAASPNAYLMAPWRERCWDGSRLAGVALAAEAFATRRRESYLQPGAVTFLNGMQEAMLHAAGITPQRLHRTFHPVVLEDERRARGDHYCYVGRLVPEKGVDVAIRAAAIAGVTLWVVGDGRSRADLERLALDLRADVRFVGAMPHRDSLSLMRSSRALVVPSTWPEVWPFVVLEAIAADVPVVASSVGGMADQLADDRGFLFPPGDVDALAHHLANIDRFARQARDVSAAARNYAGLHWTPDAWEANIADAFELAGTSVA